MGGVNIIKRKKVALFVLGLLTVVVLWFSPRLLIAQSAQGNRWRLVHEKGMKVRVLWGERPLLEYRYEKSVLKPYVHPFYAPNGFTVTLDSPPDHIHHRGLFLGWSNVNGFDFWSEGGLETQGRIVHQRFELLQASGKQVTIRVLNHWLAKDKILLVERRTLRVQVPAKEVIWLEWESEFSAAEKVTLFTPPVYNGLGIRFPRSMDGGGVLNSNGTTEVERANGEKAVWCTYFGQMGGKGGGWCGVAVFDHPKNSRHPNPFFVMNQPFGFLSAAPTFYEPLTIEPAKPLKLRYAIISYLGQADKDKLTKLYQKWVSE